MYSGHSSDLCFCTAAMAATAVGPVAEPGLPPALLITYGWLQSAEIKNGPDGDDDDCLDPPLLGPRQMETTIGTASGRPWAGMRRR